MEPDNVTYPIRLIVAGGRAFADLPLFERSMWKFLSAIGGNTTNVQIVEGGAKGADRLGSDFAKKYKFPTRRFDADWDQHGKSAGPRRNTKMRNYSTHLIAFWDGVSKGTKDMINQARDHKLNVEVIYYDNGSADREYLSDHLKG
jgi:hypothetical protein